MSPGAWTLKSALMQVTTSVHALTAARRGAARRLTGIYTGDIVKCPKCGSGTFVANIDDKDTFLCINDDCKWKYTWSNSTEMIGVAKERFDILRSNPDHNLIIEDWGAWYSGWIEGRFDLVGKTLSQKCAKCNISLPNIKRLSQGEWESIKNRLGKNRSF
jgi:hypothetical protein